MKRHQTNAIRKIMVTKAFMVILVWLVHNYINMVSLVKL